jgi:hypothetical protein
MSCNFADVTFKNQMFENSIINTLNTKEHAYIINLPLESISIHHHHRPLIPLSGVGITCFLLPFSSTTRHLTHSFILISSFTQSIHLSWGNIITIYYHNYNIVSMDNSMDVVKGD